MCARAVGVSWITPSFQPCMTKLGALLVRSFLDYFADSLSSFFVQLSGSAGASPTVGGELSIHFFNQFVSNVQD